MTPAIKTLENAGVVHELLRYETAETDGDYGIEAAHQLGLTPSTVFKTLVVQTVSHAFAVAIVPVAGRLDLKKLAAALSAKKTLMAEPAAVEKQTGYVLGGVSPLGQKKRLTTIIDASAEPLAILYVSGGRRGFEIGLAPGDLARLTGARFAAIASHG